MNDEIITETIQVFPRCAKCRSDDLRMPERITTQDDLTDDSVLTCADCGTIITYAALVEACEADIAKDIEDDLSSASDDTLG